MSLVKKPVDTCLLFDDTDDHYYGQHVLPCSVNISIDITKTILFAQYAKNLPTDELDFILKNCPHVEQFMRFDHTKAYRGHDQLDVYVQQVNRLLVVISTGEFQPARYKIYVEGVFGLTP